MHADQFTAGENYYGLRLEQTRGSIDRKIHKIYKQYKNSRQH